MEDRIQHYLGNNTNIAPVFIRYEDLPAGTRPLLFCYDDFSGNEFPTRKTTYYHDMARSIHHLPHLWKTPFLFHPYDRVEGFDIPTLVKSRPIHGYGRSVLFNLNYLRHFADVYRVDELDIPYEKKKDMLVWRGSDTGYGFGNEIPYRLVSRQTLLEVCAANPSSHVNVGLTTVSVNRRKPLSEPGSSNFRQYVRPKMALDELLQYKFLLSVEGNDVATNLKWILHSNSVAFCPPFSMNSWILEERLLPWEHYIPVRADFQDLNDQVEWAINHPDVCKKISTQARAYMSQFMDIHTERAISDAVLQSYSENVRLIR